MLLVGKVGMGHKQQCSFEGDSARRGWSCQAARPLAVCCLQLQFSSCCQCRSACLRHRFGHARVSVLWLNMTTITVHYLEVALVPVGMLRARQSRLAARPPPG